MKRLILNEVNPHLKEVLHGASKAFILKILGSSLAFAFNIIVARKLGARDAGLFFLAITIAVSCSVISRLGLDNTLLRFTSANSATGDWFAVKGLYQKGISVALASSIIIASLLWLATPWIGSNIFHKAGLKTPLRWVAFTVPCLSMIALHAELLKGIKQILISQFVQNVGLPGFALIGMFFIHSNPNVSDVAQAYVLASFFVAIIGVIEWHRLNPQLRCIQGNFDNHKIWQSSIPLFGVAILNLVTTTTATFCLSYWGTSADVGIFQVAQRTAVLTSFVLLSVNTIVAPKLAAFYKQGDIKNLTKVVQYATKLMILSALPILIIFIFTPKWVLSLFGADFIPGAHLLSILAMGQFVNVATGSVGYLIIMSGNEILYQGIVAASALFNVMACLIFIPIFGSIGAAIVTAASQAILNLTAVYFAWKRLHIFTIPLSLRFFLDIGKWH